uniref:SHSP domain-containing protein n=1 Tax=Panagrolaimus sp. JU765 TaxID=591449 RepID=A0AC34RMT9_9BILA
MAMFLYDPFRIQRRDDPMAMLDTFFDEANRLRVRDHAAKLSVQPNGDFNYAVNVGGFKPEELKVDIEGDELVVKGDHKEHHNGESVHRQFVRRMTLPKKSCKDSIKCDLDENGKLIVTGTAKAIADDQKKSIPIGFKQSGSQKAVEDKGETCKKCSD